jgi:hypothetical protein
MTSLAISQCVGSSVVGSLAAYAMNLNPQRGAVIGAMNSLFHIVKAKWDAAQSSQPKPLSPPVALGVGVWSTLLTSSVALVAQFAATYFGHPLSVPQAWVGTEVSSISLTTDWDSLNFPNVGILVAAASGLVLYGINHLHVALIGVVNVGFNALSDMRASKDSVQKLVQFEGGWEAPQRTVTPLITCVSSFVGRNLGSCRIPSIGRAEAWVIASIAHKVGFFFGSWAHSHFSSGPSAKKNLLASFNFGPRRSDV